MLPLTFARPGDEYKIVRIGGKDEVKRHLDNLGFVENEVIKVISETGGNLIIGVKDSRIAISKEMAGRIVVKDNR